MVLKDWKKVGKFLYKRKDGYQEFTIIQSYNDNSYNFDAYSWRNYHSAIETLEKRNFKTKSQALKYAKQYMRTH